MIFVKFYWSFSKTTELNNLSGTYITHKAEEPTIKRVLKNVTEGRPWYLDTLFFSFKTQWFLKVVSKVKNSCTHCNASLAFVWEWSIASEGVGGKCEAAGQAWVELQRIKFSTLERVVTKLFRNNDFLDFYFSSEAERTSQIISGILYMYLYEM